MRALYATLRALERFEELTARFFGYTQKKEEVWKKLQSTLKTAKDGVRRCNMMGELKKHAATIKIIQQVFNDDFKYAVEDSRPSDPVERESEESAEGLNFPNVKDRYCIVYLLIPILHALLVYPFHPRRSLLTHTFCRELVLSTKKALEALGKTAKLADGKLGSVEFSHFQKWHLFVDRLLNDPDSKKAALSNSDDVETIFKPKVMISRHPKLDLNDASETRSWRCTFQTRSRSIPNSISLHPKLNLNDAS